MRGLAILLLVAFHLTGLGTNKPDPTAMRFHDSLLFVRMPLFAAISGWVYALRPPAPGGSLRWLRARTRRLLLPILGIGVIVLFVETRPLRLEWPASFRAAIEELLLPRPGLWFVQALFVISALAVALDAAGALANAKRWGLAAGLALLLPTVLPPALFFPNVHHDWFGGVLYLSGFFLLGLGLQRYERELARPWVVPAASALLALGVLLHQLVLAGRLDLVAMKGTPLALLVGAPAILLLLRFRDRFRRLAWLGPYSLAIYLYHGELAYLFERGLARTGATLPPLALYAAEFVVAIAGPVLLHRLFARWTPTRRLFLGLR